MKVDITQLLVIFDNLSPLTEEDQAMYWFETKRKDGITIYLFVSIYEERAGISIYDLNGNPLTHVRYENCSEVRVLDEKKPSLEIIGHGRCFVSLLSSPILEYSEKRE